MPNKTYQATVTFDVPVCSSPFDDELEGLFEIGYFAATIQQLADQLKVTGWKLKSWKPKK